MGIIVAMLLIVSPSSPVTISGFSDLARCEESIPSVAEFFAESGLTIRAADCKVLPPPWAAPPPIGRSK